MLLSQYVIQERLSLEAARSTQPVSVVSPHSAPFDGLTIRPPIKLVAHRAHMRMSYAALTKLQLFHEGAFGGPPEQHVLTD